MAESSTASNGFVIPRSSNLYKPKEEEETPDYTSSIQYRENERNPMRTKAYDAVRQAGGNPNAARIAAEAVDFVPGVGEAAGAIDVAQSLKNKEYLGAGLNTAALAVGTIPIIGDAAGKALRAIGRKIYKPKVYTRKDGSIFDEKDADFSDIQKEYKLEESQRQIQTPQLKEAAQLLEDKKISKETFDEIADTFYPSKLITELPEVPIPRRIEAVVAGKKAQGNVITPERSEELAGQTVSTRLDIPAYNNYNTWVVTVASPSKAFKSTYGESANLTDVVFGSPTGQAKAIKIATGGAKTPFAVMEGAWKNKSTKELALIAEKHLANPTKSDWIQVGMNPYKHSYFYDKASMLPVTNADEVIQIGSLVLAKGTKYGKKTDYEFKKGGTMAKNAQAEMITIGLQDEGGMVDEASGNEVPNGALKEEVRDDQPAMLSPGEFVIPAYAVRYIGVERLVSLLREAKQGMEQLDDIGLTGEPNSDDSGLETAVLPSEMQGGMPKLAVGGFPTIRPGAVTTKALTNQPTQQQQFGVAPPAAIQPVMQPTQPTAVPAFGTAPSPLTQQMYRPTAPVRPPGQQNVTYPEYQYSPTPGGTGYGVEEYVGPQGQAIFVTTIGGKPISKIPEGYLTRAEYTKKQEEGKQTTTPPTELQRKPEYIDPGGVGPDSGYMGWSDRSAQVMDYAIEDGTQFSRDATFAETLGNMGRSFVQLGVFAMEMAPSKALATMIQAGVLTLTGKTKEEIEEIIGNKRTSPKKILQKIATQKAKDDLDKAAEEEIIALQGGDPTDAQIAAAEDPTADATSSPSMEIGGKAVDPFSDTALGLGLGMASTPEAQEASQSFTDQAISAAEASDYDFGYSAPSAPSDAPSDMDAANVSMPNKGGFIGMAEGGLIKVGDKTYGPEDFGFANKGTFVTKKKTRKRKRGKGLASK